ncbi:MAG: cryptochrome/photolyase family protein [Thermoleophilaceae bacterium]
MPSTALMWFRRDLRVRDLPALAHAAEADRIVPVFVFDDRLLKTGRFPSASRTAFMHGCLEELDATLRDRGARLVIRHGRPEQQVPELARETGAQDVFWTADSSPWSRMRDQKVIDALAADQVRAHPCAGAFVADDPSNILTGQGTPYTVFSPFARTWMGLKRREAAPSPRTLTLPPNLRFGHMPSLADLGVTDAPELAFRPGEEAGRRAAASFLRSRLADYDDVRNHAAGGTSRMSPYLRWGCVSPLQLEQRAAKHGGAGADTYRSELAWRDFYAAVLMHFPYVVKHEFQERYRDLEWARTSNRLDAWKEGRTGFPFVDAGMRQLLAEGWMHNRLRMVVGSFLTKDLHLDWRLGESHFMEHLVDGDMAANNGGWQWIASVGTDPKPYFQRLFNPIRQQEKFDPAGAYVRRWVPELAHVPDDKLTEPWAMSGEEQARAGCVIGTDYPEPIVDHAEERRVAQERYRAASG